MNPTVLETGYSIMSMWRTRILSNFGRLSHNTLVRRHINQIAVNESEKVQYPPVKPKHPPGKWPENMSSHRAWNLYNYSQELLCLPTTQLRLSHMEETSKMYSKKSFDFKPHSYKVPRRLEFNQNKTKTAMINELPKIYSELNVDEEFKLIKDLIKEMIISEHFILKRHSFSVEEGKEIGTRSYDLETMDRIILKQMILIVMSVLSRNYPHLLSVHLGENSKVEAQWDRLSNILKPEKLTFVEGYGEERLITKVQQFQGESKTSFQLRSDLPLEEFVSREDPLCMEAEYPHDYQYSPHSVGMKPYEMPAAFTAGCKIGDPCEFGLLGILNTGTHKTRREKESYTTTPDAIPQFHHCMAMGTLFIWTVAQAHYLGFSKFVDIPFPLTGQAIVTDSQTFSFYAYQLNTLKLWVDDDTEPLRNLCWHSPEMKLYESVEDGEIKGFNDDALKLLIKFFALSPKDRCYDMRPTLSKEDEQSELIPKKVHIGMKESIFEFDES